VIEGRCTECHDPHRSDFGALLAGPSPLICTGCHADVVDFEGAESIHPPSEGDCLDCHQPHGGNVGGLLTGTSPSMCFDCHDEGGSDFRTAHLEIEASTMDCLSCHEPHHSPAGGLLHELAHVPFEDGDCADCHDQLDEGTPVATICADCHDLPWSEASRAGERHVPFEDGDCTACHNPHVARGEMLLPLDVSEACIECHDPADLYPDLELAHEPVREGQCNLCHESHGSEHSPLLKDPGSSLCFGCHESLGERTRSAVVHDPFEKGRCARCHDPHGSEVEGSLVESVPGLCFECHGPSSDEMKSNHRSMDLSGADCSSCHDPHASDVKGLLHRVVHEPFAKGRCVSCHETGTGIVPADQRGMCLECHPGMREDLKEAPLHDPLARGEDACTACHDPHTAPFAALMPAQRDQVCGRCHGEIVNGLAEAEFAHPPQSTGTCSICHDPHLASPEEGMSLAERRCNACHPFKDHVVHPMGDGVIDPLTGRELGCLSCHDQHGSDWEYFLSGDPSGRLCVMCHTDKIRSK
jgi:predicted CXXCH cytochrome family protein